MTPKQQQIAMAEACGWVHHNMRPSETERHQKKWRYLSDLPDYLNDLNAMHEAVSIFDYDQADEFEDHLCDICKRSNDKKDNPVPWRFAVINATAAQRARAFLETLGLWDIIPVS